jgi:hypothetical protein
MRETWEMYATYYDAMIHAAGTARQSIVKNLVNLNHFEPDWDPFQYQLREPDARLRLASLQVVLRRPSAQTTVPNRLAQVGSSYYDPFSGFCSCGQKAQVVNVPAAKLNKSIPVIVGSPSAGLSPHYS